MATTPSESDVDKEQRKARKKERKEKKRQKKEKKHKKRRREEGEASIEVDADEQPKSTKKLKRKPWTPF